MVDLAGGYPNGPVQLKPCLVALSSDKGEHLRRQCSSHLSVPPRTINLTADYSVPLSRRARKARVADDGTGFIAFGSAA